jgi:outer membrane protein assembly factor BamB
MTRFSRFARRNSLLLAAFSTGICTLVSTAAADWTTYRGPSANGTSTEKLPASLPKEFKEAWKASVGTGTSSVTVSGNKVYTMGNTGGKDIVWCFDAGNGSVVWKHEYPMDLDKRQFEGGTAATPTVDGNRVYTVSHQGDLFCLDAATGKPVWYKHYQKDLGGKRPQWGYAGSATIDGDLVIVDVGGTDASTVALNKATGATVWKSGSDKAGYASPVVATVQGTRTVVMFKGSSLIGLDVKDGKELWRTGWKTSYDVNAATPLVAGDKIFVTSGYGTGCGLYEVGSGNTITERWKNKALKMQINSPVAFQGHAFGPDGNVGDSPLTCVEVATGAVKWKEKSVNGGALVLADGKLICLTEKGELVICEASSEGFKPLARGQVLGKKNWVQPTYANGHIFCRNNEGDLVALEMK